MKPALVIARLTLREAARRKLVAVFLVLTIAMVGLSAWGFYHLAHTNSITSGEVQIAMPQALILFMFMFSFVVALSASAIASPAVSAEVESGVLLTVATRPIRRSEILIGKWFGLAALVAGYSVFVSVLEILVVKAVSGFLPPNPMAVAAYLFAEGAVLLTLVLTISTRLSTLATGVLGVALFGAGWLSGVVGALGTSLNISTLRTVGNVSRYLLPTDGLWHGAIYYLEPSGLIARHFEGDTGGAGNPFFALSAPSWDYLLYAAIWALVIFGIGITSFQKREL
ncbi:MAG: ABC transporter permease [Acidimicrobiales bacterium]|jgi:ABC-type transport system involved in multi-copper enzyme maturation permease subunit